MMMMTMTTKTTIVVERVLALGVAHLLDAGFGGIDEHVLVAAHERPHLRVR